MQSMVGNKIKLHPFGECSVVTESNTMMHATDNRYRIRYVIVDAGEFGFVMTAFIWCPLNPAFGVQEINTERMRRFDRDNEQGWYELYLMIKNISKSNISTMD